MGASIAGFDVRVFASDHPERAAGLVLVDASYEDQPHEVPQMARFVPLCRRSAPSDCAAIVWPENRIAGFISAAIARATRFRAAGYQTAADEIIHIPQSASEVSQKLGRKLTIPVLVITGGRGADEIGDSCSEFKPRCQNEDV